MAAFLSSSSTSAMLVVRTGLARSPLPRFRCTRQSRQSSAAAFTSSAVRFSNSKSTSTSKPKDNSGSGSGSGSAELPPFNPSPAFRKTQSPDDGWKLGDGLRTSANINKQWKKDEQAGWKSLDLDKMEKRSMYRFLTSAVVPRPIAFVSTISRDGVPNLAPFSYFSLVAHNPPLISVSFSLPSERAKDTRENIRFTKEFTVNIISEPFVEAANSTSVEAPAEIDEWIVSGLTPEPSEVVKPPRVRESAISFECKLFYNFDITSTSVAPSTSPPSPKTTHTFVLGRIHRAHIRNSVLTSSADRAGDEDAITVDPSKLRAVSRLGGTGYARIGEGFDLERPSWRKVGGEVEKLVEERRRRPVGKPTNQS